MISPSAQPRLARVAGLARLSLRLAANAVRRGGERDRREHRDRECDDDARGEEHDRLRL
jgi:hypothetical protein